MKIEPTEKNINSFLHFGWLPRTDIEPPIPVDWVSKETSIIEPTLDVGAEIIRNAFYKQVGEKKKLIVPLSGGLDSRTMLAIAKDFGHEITTVTLGTPGTYDFEIGKLVAKKTNVKHMAIDVNELKLSTNSLVSFAKKTGDWVNIIETYYNLHITELFEDTPIISGFLGDFIGGSYAFLNRWDWNQSKIHFARHNKISRNENITSPEFHPESALPKNQVYSTETTLGEYEELVLRTRHTCTLRPTAFEYDFGYITPFRDKDWVSLMTSLPNESRKQQKYYRDMLKRVWPDYFNLPTTTFHGKPLSITSRQYNIMRQRVRIAYKFRRLLPKFSDLLLGINPTVNYTDFNNKLTKNTNLREVARENLSDLEKRNLLKWINLKEINQKYFETEGTYIDPISAAKYLALINLEINLKASESTK